MAEELLCRDPKPYVYEDHAQKSNYENCKRNGMTWWYNIEKKDVLKSKVNFVDDKEEGVYTSYHDNEKVKLTVNYTHGQKDGVQKVYYDNGQLGEEIKYVKGRRDGLFVEWDIEGFKSSEVMYKNNYKVGLKKYYDHDGKVTRTEEYKMDRNPVVVKFLKDKRKEVLIDLAKYGLMPKSASKEERMR
jgi:antitoxin component YwqK of YwqJK toxin-antitoxin module